MPECRIMSRVSNPQRGLRRCGSSCRFPKPGIDGVDGSPALPKLLTRLREQVARALVSKGARLGGLGRNKEAIDVDDDLYSPALAPLQHSRGSAQPPCQRLPRP